MSLEFVDGPKKLTSLVNLHLVLEIEYMFASC